MTYIYCFFQNKTTGKCTNIGIATKWLCKHFLHGLLIQRTSSMSPWISIFRPSFTSRNTFLIFLKLPHFLVYSCSYSGWTNILAKTCNSNNQTYYACWAKNVKLCIAVSSHFGRDIKGIWKMLNMQIKFWRQLWFTTVAILIEMKWR